MLTITKQKTKLISTISWVTSLHIETLQLSSTKIQEYTSCQQNSVDHICHAVRGCTGYVFQEHSGSYSMDIRRTSQPDLYGLECCKWACICNVHYAVSYNSCFDVVKYNKLQKLVFYSIRQRYNQHKEILIVY